MGIKLKRSAVAARAPVVGDLELGELAVNTYDGTLYLKKNDGTEAIVEVTGSDDTRHGSRAGGTLHAVATTSVAGFLSSSDKTKLDGIAASANNYALPSRLGEYGQTVSNWNDVLTNGWYMGSTVTNAPNAEWYLGEVVAHNPIWTTQTLIQFTATAPCPMYRRHQNNGVWGSWYLVNRAVTISTSDPSGGRDGDIWYKV